MQSMTSHNDKRHPVSASDFRLLTESQKYGLYAECFRSAGLRGEQASYRIGYVDGATGKPPQVELTGPEKALCTPSHEQRSPVQLVGVFTQTGEEALLDEKLLDALWLMYQRADGMTDKFTLLSAAGAVRELMALRTTERTSSSDSGSKA
jgi:hypothetical protein